MDCDKNALIDSDNIYDKMIKQTKYLKTIP